MWKKKKEIVSDNRNCLHTWNVLVTLFRWNWLSQFLLQLIKLFQLPSTAQRCIHEVCVVETTVINLVSLSFFIVQNHRLKSMAPEHFTRQIWWSCLYDLTSWLYSSCIMQSSMLKRYCQQHHILCILFKFYVCFLKTEWKTFFIFVYGPSIQCTITAFFWIVLVKQRKFSINTFAASYLNTQGLNNSCLK